MRDHPAIQFIDSEFWHFPKLARLDARFRRIAADCSSRHDAELKAISGNGVNAGRHIGASLARGEPCAGRANGLDI